MTQESTLSAGRMPYLALWQELITNALVGTDRQPVRLPPPGAPVTNLLADLDPAAPERTLLGASAVLTLYRRTGRLPATNPAPAPEPCPPEAQPVCSLRAGQHLALMLDKGHREVLPEWLAAATHAGQRIPTQYLVALLEAGQKQSALRAALLPVIGQRGRWLAAQNPAWDYANADLAEVHAAVDPAQLRSAWETGKRATRQALLTRLRKQQPAQARDLVAVTWNSEKASDRTAFVTAFATGLSMDDEPFLETALDDRSKEVRRAAADLLSRLPASRFAQRMITRVQPLLTWHPGDQPHITVTLPGACDPDMVRDGIEPEPPRKSRMGEKAWWLMQMLSAIPLGFWAETWNATPADLLTAASQDQTWRNLFFEGWTSAAQRQHDPAWIEALVKARFKNITKSEFQEILPLLSPTQLEAFALMALQDHPEALHATHPASVLLQASHHTWSADLTRAVLASLRQRTAQKGTSADYAMSALLQEFALRMPPELLNEAATDWPTDTAHWHFWSNGIEQMLAVLRFRHDMLKEFQP